MLHLPFIRSRLTDKLIEKLGLLHDNTNPYRNMVMDAMRMNQGNVSQCPIVEEEPNADAARFFDLLKDSDEPLWDGCTNHSKLSV